MIYDHCWAEPYRKLSALGLYTIACLCFLSAGGELIGRNDAAILKEYDTIIEATGIFRLVFIEKFRL